jgi:hypothetical protein
MYVSSDVREPSEQVADLIRSDSSNITEKFAFLDALYIQILTKALDNFGRSTSALRQFRDVLTCLVLLQRSPSVQLLARLTRIEEQLCKTILRCLSSVLLYKHEAQEPVRLIHPSFPDFLKDPNRCSVPDLVVNAEAHETLLVSCSDLVVVSWARFHEMNDINAPGLNEVNILSQEVLALCPPGHPGHAKSCVTEVRRVVLELAKRERKRRARVLASILLIRSQRSVEPLRRTVSDEPLAPTPVTYTPSGLSFAMTAAIDGEA